MELLTFIQNTIYLIQLLLACYILYDIVIVKSAREGKLQDNLEYTHSAIGYHKISILIYGYEDQDHLKTLLPALNLQTYSHELYKIFLIQSKTFLQTNEELKPYESMIYFLEPERLEAPKNDSIQWAVEQISQNDSVDALVILDSNTLVKPDFIERVNLALTKGDVAQGYVASRNPYATFASIMEHLLFRIKNRIYNAGMYYMGFSALPLPIGFIIKTDILKKYPYTHHSLTMYAFHLMLYGVRVIWAPHAVIYRKMSGNFNEFATKEAAILFTYTQAVEFLYRHILFGLRKYSLTNMINALFLVKPLYVLFYIFNICFLYITLYLELYKPFAITCLLLLAHIALFFLKTYVAKFTARDYQALPLAFLLIPFLYLLTLIKFFAVKAAFKKSKKSLPQAPKDKRKETPENISMVDSSNPLQHPQEDIHHPISSINILNNITVQTSFGIGSKDIPCTLSIDDIHTIPSLTFTYHGKSIEIKNEETIDDLFVNLEAKLGAKGLDLHICHNCGNFQYLSSIGEMTKYTKGYCLLHKIGVPLTEDDTVYPWDSYCGDQVNKSSCDEIFDKWNRGY